MENQKHFCTCKDLNCKLHPSNHPKGCDPCIKMNHIPFLKGSSIHWKPEAPL